MPLDRTGLIGDHNGEVECLQVMGHTNHVALQYCSVENAGWKC